MNLKKIKCIVVDFDETLYSNAYWENELKGFGEFLVDKNLLPEIDGWEEKLKYLHKKYPTYHLIQFIFAFLHENGIDDSEFRKFRDNNVYEIRGADTVFINPKIISEVTKYYPVYIASDSSVAHIEFYLNHAGIDKSLFSGIYDNPYNDEGFTKIPMMKRVLKETGLKPDEIIMIGDNENADIKTAKLMGFQSKLVKSVFDTEKVLQEFVNLKSSKKI